MKRFFTSVVVFLLSLGLLTACAPQVPEGYVLVTVTPAPEAGGVSGDITVPLPANPDSPDSPPPPVDPTTAAPALPPTVVPNGVVAPTPNPLLPPATAGRIAFMGPLNQNENLQVFVVNADGTGLTHISQTSGEGYFPTLSPDGTKIAMVATGDRTPDIFVIEVATGQSTNITNRAGTDNQPVWSPDGQQIAFTSDRDGGDVDIWVMEADGSNPRRVTRTPGDDQLGSWNPDGTELVFSNTNELGEGLWRVEVASGETRVLLPVQEGTTDTAPVWSPDGTEIAFYRSPSDANPVVYTVTPDGETLTPITDGSAATIFPVYSPDGNWLVYTTINGDKQELTAFERTTGTFTPYPDLLGFATSWAPAGGVLADTGLTQGPKNTGITLDPEVMAISYKLGSDNAPVQIVEFSDYQCPFCQKWYNETFVELRRYIEDGTVQLIFVDYPLSFHPEADEAAQAARCVGDLGGNAAYWQMHDKIFEGLSAWGGQADPVPVLKELAGSVGVDSNAVEQCIRSNQYLEQVQMGINEGNRLGVSGTPTFFINGNRLVGAQPWSAFEPYLQQAGGE